MIRLQKYPRHFGLTVAQVRNNSRVSHTNDDDLFADILESAFHFVQQRSQVALLPSQWEQSDPEFCNKGPGAYFEIDRGPLIEVLGVSYVDNDGSVQSIDSTVYRVDKKSNRPKLNVAPGESWPIGLSVEDSIRVEFVAGHHVGFSLDTGTNVITPNDMGRFSNQDVITFSTFGGELPSPIDPDFEYTIINKTAETFQISLDGSTAIDFSDAGTGQFQIDYLPPVWRRCILMLTGYWYIHPDAYQAKTMHHSAGVSLDAAIVAAGGKVVYA